MKIAQCKPSFGADALLRSEVSGRYNIGIQAGPEHPIVDELPGVLPDNLKIIIMNGQYHPEIHY